MNEIAFLDLKEISLSSVAPMLSMIIFALFILIVGTIKKTFQEIFTAYFVSSQYL